ncbi:MAG: polyketide cyclase, partial [Chitinophagaceae bacterium]|nr:polyketide cyclase [Chitinophagaceae bacterium]
KSVFTEVIEQKKIAYEHISGHFFIATIEFEANEHSTVMQWEMLFETAEEYQKIIIEYKAGESLQQNINRLTQYLEQSN